ncbi:DNA cytosine methyltransferase [Aestuariivivens sediminicola]|uniref:DNA cytosine methyltransferase n=1 Tax=Aestuariivivens sediminicola TaxID=2913560 RepID=UPI001F585FF7|nr:DNA cytosine methyltransferase [Aestuariivivens sediminicola]
MSNKKKEYKVIDLFAGPGGLAEGFSSVLLNGNRRFSIELSIEKDDSAHKTLLLRSFCRQFKKGELPPEYYQAICLNDINERERRIEALFGLFPQQAQSAKSEALKFELGKDSNDFLDNKIEGIVEGSKDWVLIGGPPCQAYSMAGRARVGGISSEDHRVYLYKEYLRVIAKHSPAVFVMENVKGLLSAKVEGKSVFQMMLDDLSAPYAVTGDSRRTKYKIYSLVKEKIDSPRDFVINSEDFGIPQKRHRVILIGVREGIHRTPKKLKKFPRSVNIDDVINDLPPIRSGLNRCFDKYVVSKKNKRIRKYRKVIDTDSEWCTIMNSCISDLIRLNGFSPDDLYRLESPINGTGGEFIEINNDPSSLSIHDSWYVDKNLKGVLNHQSRSHLTQDLKRYLFSTIYTEKHQKFPRMTDFKEHSSELLPDHFSADSGNFTDRFRVQQRGLPATTITSHISKDGHYFIHYDKTQVRSLTVREAARIQTFPDNYLFRGSRTMQYHQVGNAVPPYLAYQIAEIVLGILDVQ